MRISICKACQNQQRGVKTRLLVPHTCIEHRDAEAKQTLKGFKALREEDLTLQELAEQYLELYDSRFSDEQQCSGWHQLKALVQSDKGDLTNVDLTPFHQNLREVIRRHWGNIRKCKI